jgi:hypothetical protein
MTIITAIILGLFISFIIIYVVLNIDKFKPKDKNIHQDVIEKIHSRIAKANGASIEQFSLKNLLKGKQQNDDLYEKAHFLNKHCTNLDAFIINDEINANDLMKLAELNGIKLQISEGWYKMTIELIKELNNNGWDKKVTCIKEKYASLKFYTNHPYESTIHNIIEKYEKKSEHVCETCSNRGEIRYNSGWEYVACRKHYVENRGKIKVDNTGFNLNGDYYTWNEIIDASFEDFDHNERYKFLKIEFRRKVVKHQGWTDNRLFVSRNTIGYGNFLNHLPISFYGLNLNYLRLFENPEFCDVCGYKAVYNKNCECCENDTWKAYCKRWASEENTEERKYDHIKYNQIYWQIDEGEIYESKQNNYPKNPNYQLIFTEEELKEYEEDDL